MKFWPLPPALSDYASHVDRLLWALAGVTGAVAIGICLTIVVFAVRYRRGRRVERHWSATHAGESRNRTLEIVWIAIPLAVFLAFYAWGARLYFEGQRTGSNPLEIHIVAKQWMWKLQHSDGRREINVLHVPAGRAVRLRMTSEDVIHSFYVPALRLKHDVLPARYETLTFSANHPGRYPLTCSEYCGLDHSHMGGELIVMEPQAYADWLAADAGSVPLNETGAALFQQAGCADCHDAGPGPDLRGLAGSSVTLADGTRRLADADYLREAIMTPAAHRRPDSSGRMPAYAGRLTEEQLVALLEYLASLPEERE